MVEQWRPVAEPGYEDHYEVSDLGRVRNTKTGHVLCPGDHPKGYTTLTFCVQKRRRSVLIHRVVLMAWVGPPPPGMETLHENGIRSDNRLSNIRWGTPVENAHDKRRHGTTSEGDRNGMAKISSEQAQQIRERCAGGETQRSVAEAYGLAQSQVSRIVTGKRRGPHSEE